MHTSSTALVVKASDEKVPVRKMPVKWILIAIGLIALWRFIPWDSKSPGNQNAGTEYTELSYKRVYVDIGPEWSQDLLDLHVPMGYDFKAYPLDTVIEGWCRATVGGSITNIFITDYPVGDDRRVATNKPHLKSVRGGKEESVKLHSYRARVSPLYGQGRGRVELRVYPKGTFQAQDP